MSKELVVDPNELIVSMTDTKGKITYANDIFCTLAGYKKEEIMGKPHNIIRHPDIPRAVFKLLWDRVLNGETIYAFVKNQAKSGDYYWVKAYVFPIMENGRVEEIVSYRKPINDYAKKVIVQIYALLVDYERSHSVDESVAFLVNYLAERNLTYDQFIERLSMDKQVTNAEAINVDRKVHHDTHLIVKSNILKRVKDGEAAIKVPDACECEFGKWCESVRHESFTKCTSWSNTLRAHEQYHANLREYVSRAKNGESGDRLRALSNGLDEKIDEIFEYLEDALDHCE
jgi:PAS domain S-box-containing protein